MAFYEPRSVSRWHGAQKTQGFFTGIFELVLLVRRNVDDVAGADVEDLPSHQQTGGAPEDVDAVVVVVAVERGLPAGRDFVVPHAEVHGPIPLADDDLFTAAHRAAPVVGLDFDAFPRVIAVFSRKAM